MNKFQLQESAISAIQARLPAVKMVVLFGSRAKGKETDKSDWDIGVLAKSGTYEGLAQFKLQEELSDILAIPFDRIDLVNLRYCSPLLGFAIACDGKPLYQETSITFTRFQVKASKMYADTAKFRRLERAYLGFSESFEAKFASEYRAGELTLGEYGAEQTSS